MDLLVGYDWPGNVREVENVINRLLVVGSESGITHKHVERVLRAELAGQSSVSAEYSANARNESKADSSFLPQARCAIARIKHYISNHSRSEKTGSSQRTRQFFRRATRISRRPSLPPSFHLMLQMPRPI